MTDPDPLPPRDAPPAWRDRIELLAQSPPLTIRRVGTAALVVVAALAVAWFALRPPAGPATESVLPLAGSSADASTASSSTTSAASTVFAHAAGAVVHPGVYELPSGARVTDLLDAAGGPVPGADVDRLNLAALVTDGERVYVPRIGEAMVAVDDSMGGDAASGPVDLNTATLEQLDALPGVGPATAKAILDERKRRGRFRSVDDLLDVRGIGPAKLDALRDLVKV